MEVLAAASVFTAIVCATASIYLHRIMIHASELAKRAVGVLIVLLPAMAGGAMVTKNLKDIAILLVLLIVASASAGFGTAYAFFRDHEVLSMEEGRGRLR